MSATNVRAGFHPNFDLRQFSDSERKILQFLARDWFVTRNGGRLELGSAAYRPFLMKPTTVIAEMFGIEREIMVVFSEYDAFEPRTLDAFDSFKNNLPDLRVEDLCRVVISNDSAIESKITSLLKSNPEQPVVIPFTYTELCSALDGSFVLNRFRKHFFSRNLFDFLSPLKSDLYFFGRQQLVHELIDRHRSQEHAGLFGLRKSGKTSVVHAISRSLRATGERSLFIDCETPDVHQRRWFELLELVVQLYHRAIGSKADAPMDGTYTATNAGKRFDEDISRIYESKKRQPTLLIFDEIERITPATASSEHWKTGPDFIYFWQTLRAYYQRQPHVYTYMLVGTNPSAVEKSRLADQDNPLFASVPSQYVPNFSVPQVAEMVTQLGRYMGLHFDDAITAKLTEDFGGHPFLIRQACSMIHKKSPTARPVRVDKPLYEKVKQDYVRESAEYLDMIVDVLKRWYPEEYDMLTFLATGQQQSFDDFAKNDVHLTRHLTGYGLVQISDHGCAFNIESLRQHLEYRHRYERANLTSEQKLTELSERRNTLERTLRDVLGKALRLTYGQKTGDRVLAALAEKRRDALKDAPHGSLLSPESSPLFFSELIALVSREWDAVKNVFGADKPKVVMMLEDINKYGRPDAHAKAINDDDFTQVRLHLGRLEEWLASW